MEFLLKYQLDIMLYMCGVCGILTVMTLVTESLPRNTKRIIALMEISAMLLLVFDRFAYMYRGDVSQTGYYMVRLSNGMVYILSLFIPFLVSKYLEDAMTKEGGFSCPPRTLIAADITFAAGVLFIIIAIFTGLYYGFDETNTYHRAPFNWISYIFPFLILILQETTLIRYKSRIDRQLADSMIICIALPTVATVLQFFLYGLSLINLTTAAVVCVFYTYTLRFLSRAAERAKEHEIEYYREAQKKEAALFEQTTEALANAIDAKDNYTRGHSTRVAAFSKKIAKEAGLSGPECDQVYFAALLHDIGKIGVKGEIITKPGRLTDDEYRQITEHALLGSRILSSIKQAPFLSDGARWHHERYDGTGYPDGLKGEDIPLIARIIAIADAYDAMTSDRGYNKPMGKEEVMAEIRNGKGTQFDPALTEITLGILDKELK